MIALERISHITVLVRDLDAALNWYTEKLGFERRRDFSLGPSERWVTIGLNHQPELSIVLECPSHEFHGADIYAFLARRIGKGSPLVLTTRDCHVTHRELLSRGVNFVSGPSEFPWGTTAHCEDLYGNPITLLKPIHRWPPEPDRPRLSPEALCQQT